MTIKQSPESILGGSREPTVPRTPPFFLDATLDTTLDFNMFIYIT
jgi:hypothetical protein